MTMTVKAVYEGGVLRPNEPLPFAEGANVDVTVAETIAPQTLTEDEIYDRIKSAKSFHEWFELTKLLPADDGSYDILKALDRNRRLAGERPLLPDEEASS